LLQRKQLMNFVTSLSVAEHPLAQSKKEVKERYYCALEHIVVQCADDRQFSNARLKQYRIMLLGNAICREFMGGKSSKMTRQFVNDSLSPCGWKHRYWLLCDAALLLSDKVAIITALRFFGNLRER